MRVVYFDNNATTKVAPEVLEEMLPYFSDLYGNPSSMHFFGGQVADKLDEARARLAALIGAQPDEIIFTACGTESDNAAIRSALDRSPGRRHIVTTRVEHPAVLTLCRRLEEQGYRVTYLPVDEEGLLDLNHVDHAITDGTAVVSVMWANNETGVLFPVQEIAVLAKEKGAFFHTDAVQVIGKLPCNLAASQVDFLALSGHKLHAPKGVGALYVRRGTPFTPFIIGGHQEHGTRGGTENVASIIGLGKAAELAAQTMTEEQTRVRAMRNRLEEGILSKAPGAVRNGNGEQRLPNTSSISFEYIEGEAILLHLSDLGICASSGSACTSGSLEPSHVLRAMGVPFTRVHGSLRLSLSRYNTDEEVDYVLEHLPGIVRKLRELSPAGREELAGIPEALRGAEGRGKGVT